MLSRRMTIALALVAALSALAAAQTTWYVDDDADPNGTGTSWQTAFQLVQDALDVATAGDEIRVAGGTYVPTAPIDPNDPRTATFQLVSGVRLYGGYAGLADPNDPDVRDFGVYESILSGDLGGNDRPDFSNNDENCYHVVTATGTDSTAAVGGFTITAGNANSFNWPYYAGGGMFIDAASPTVVDCTLRSNSARWYGAGMHVTLESHPTVVRCAYTDNLSFSHGAGMNNWHGSNPRLYGCTFKGNRAIFGAGMQNSDNSNPTLVNCTFVANAAAYSGGIDNVTSSPVLINCTLSGNSAVIFGGGVYSETDSYPVFVNAVLWGNSDSGGTDESAQIHNDDLYGASGSTVNYCCVQGWTGELDPNGVGNISSDPLFADPDNDDCHLTTGSPCIDAGDNTAVPADVADLDGDGDVDERIPFDLDGNPRFVQDPFTPDTGVPDPPVYRFIVDMGAYEYQFCFGDLDGDDDVDIGDVAQLLGSYGETGGMTYYDGDLDGDGDVDLADLAELLGVYGDVCS